MSKIKTTTIKCIGCKGRGYHFTFEYTRGNENVVLIKDCPCCEGKGKKDVRDSRVNSKRKRLYVWKTKNEKEWNL